MQHALSLFEHRIYPSYLLCLILSSDMESEPRTLLTGRLLIVHDISAGGTELPDVQFALRVSPTLYCSLSVFNSGSPTGTTVNTQPVIQLSV